MIIRDRHLGSYTRVAPDDGNRLNVVRIPMSYAAAAFGTWLPIKTAPMDGTYILVYPPTWHGEFASIAYWHSERSGRYTEPYWKRTDAPNRIIMCLENPPTHWMPLPPPPQTEE